MKRHLLLALIGWLAGAQAWAACTMRFAYPDQHRPPYFLGDGLAIGTPAGAGVDIMREFAASGNCGLTMLRMPPLRLRHALALGAIDVTPADISAAGQPGVVLPRDAQGQPDARRGTPLVVVAYVRARDGVPRHTDPLAFARTRIVGTMHGASYAPALREAGARVDDGGTTPTANLEKLRRGRIDAFVVAMLSPEDLDAFVHSRFGGDIVRLEKPVMKYVLWLAVSQAFYNAYSAQVEHMWNWMASDGNRRYVELLRQYNER